MVARIRSEPALAVIFSRDGEEPQTEIAATPLRAWMIAVRFLSLCSELHAGDQLLVQHYQGGD